MTTARREELRDPSHLEHREEDEQDTRGQGDPGNERRRVLLAGDLRRQHRARGNRRQARARSGRDLSAGAEDRVQDRAGGRGVEPVLQRDPGDAGVAEVLGNDQGCDGDPGDQVSAEPATIVGADPTEDGNQTRSIPPRCRGPSTHGRGHYLTRLSVSSHGGVGAARPTEGLCGGCSRRQRSYMGHRSSRNGSVVSQQVRPDRPRRGSRAKVLMCATRRLQPTAAASRPELPVPDRGCVPVGLTRSADPSRMHRSDGPHPRTHDEGGGHRCQGC